MTNEKISEIIKALAYGVPAVEIAEIEDVNISDVRNISLECADEIAECKQYVNMKGGA